MLLVAYFVLKKREIIKPHGVWRIEGIFPSLKSIYFYENKVSSPEKRNNPARYHHTYNPSHLGS
jgi:hypothetical protein